MIFLDKPFVSNFLLRTIKENHYSVVTNEFAKELKLIDGYFLLEEEKAVQAAMNTDFPQIYTTSENSLGWISKNLSSTMLPCKIDLFKDKAKFRTLISAMYPDFYFREILLSDLDMLSIDELPMPFIVKPTAGFFSKGVHKVSQPGEWEKTKLLIDSEMQVVGDLYPVEVLNTTSFVIEQYIDGEEFAIDAYYNEDGEPVILSIFKHLFSSAEDVRDRVYVTSKEIIEEHIDRFTEFLREIGRLTNVRNFPVHVELRRDSLGLIVPIEINPMRFGGWCSTADLTYFAYGFNPYEYYFAQERPDWREVLGAKEGKLYSIVVLDNSTGFEESEIESFDYDLLLSRFDKPLDLRRLDFREYPVFGFVFVETRVENFLELDRILKSDLREFIILKS